MMHRQTLGWSRQQGWRCPSGSVSLQSILDERQYPSPLLFEGCYGCEDPLRESEAPLRLRPKRQPPANDSRSNGLLSTVIGGLKNVRVLHKCPKGRPELGEIPAKLLGFGVSRFFPQGEKPAESGSNAAELLPELLQGDLVFQIPMPQGEDLLDLIQGPFPDALGSALAVHQFFEISCQVRPAQLPLFGGKLGVGGIAIRHDQPFKVPKESLKCCLAPVGIDIENGQRIRDRNPKPLEVMLQIPTGLIDVDCLSLLDGFSGFLIRSFQGRREFSFCLADAACRKACLRAKEVDQQFANQVFAEVVSAAQEPHQGFETKADDGVANGIRHLGGKMFAAAAGTNAGVKPKLGNDKLKFLWKIHLLDGLEGKAGQVAGAKSRPTGGTSGRKDILDFVHPFGRKRSPARPRMPFLATWFSARGFWVSRRFSRWILGRGLMTVAGVRSHLGLKLQDFLLGLFQSHMKNGDISKQLLQRRSKILDFGNGFPRKLLCIQGPRRWNLELGNVHELMIKEPGRKYKGVEGERLRRKFPTRTFF